MTKKQALKAVVFLTVFLWLLVTVTYIIRTNGDVKDRFTGFYAEKENTIDAILVGSSPVYPYYLSLIHICVSRNAGEPDWGHQMLKKKNHIDKRRKARI